MPVPTTPLTTAEVRTLDACEKVIAKGEQTFVEVGRALATIRDDRLYRATHSTFDAYLRERWDWRKSYGYYLIDAAQTADKVAASTTVDIPNEATARVLGEIIERTDEATAIAALEEADANGKVTAKAVAEAYERRMTVASAAAAPAAPFPMPVVTGATLAATPSPHPVFSGSATPSPQAAEAIRLLEQVARIDVAAVLTTMTVAQHDRLRKAAKRATKVTTTLAAPVITV